MTDLSRKENSQLRDEGVSSNQSHTLIVSHSVKVSKTFQSQELPRTGDNPSELKPVPTGLLTEKQESVVIYNTCMRRV